MFVFSCIMSFVICCLNYQEPRETTPLTTMIPVTEKPRTTPTIQTTTTTTTTTTEIGTLSNASHVK